MGCIVVTSLDYCTKVQTSLLDGMHKSNQCLQNATLLNPMLHYSLNTGACDQLQPRRHNSTQTIPTRHARRPASHHTPTKLRFPKYPFPRRHRTLFLQRAATRARLVKNLRNAAQALAALQAKQQQEGVAPPQQAGGAMGMASETGGIPPRQQPPLIGGDTAEVVALCVAIEQCLFHRIRVKDFGERGTTTTAIEEEEVTSLGREMFGVTEVCSSVWLDRW